MKTTKTNRPTIDTLEARVMFAATPLTVATAGNELVINGTAKNDVITLSKTQEGYVIKNTVGKDVWTKTVGGDFASVRINAGAGNDKVTVDASVTTNTRIFGQAGNDTLAGGAGSDTFVTIGGGVDRVTGTAGNDSFWTDNNDVITDATAAESYNVHKVAAFESIKTKKTVGKKTTTTTTVVGKELNGAKLLDPTVTTAGITYKNFAGSKLFADAGPAADDVTQGYVGDCYFLATLSSVAKTNANTIKQSVVDLGDGTFAVRFFKGKAQAFVRVDADLPVWNNGQLAYAGKGAEGSIWTAVMEKAFAVLRKAENSYASIEAGWMSEAYSALGKASNSLFSATSAAQLLTIMSESLKAGQSVTYAANEPTDGAPLIGNHAYSVVSVNLEAGTVTLRNPWAIDGAGNDGSNDGYVTITAAQAKNAFMGLMTANV